MRTAGPGGTLTTLGRRWSNLFAEIVPLGRMEARIPWFADGEGLKVGADMGLCSELGLGHAKMQECQCRSKFGLDVPPYSNSSIRITIRGFYNPD